MSDQPMSVLDHLDELRKRIIRSAIAILMGAVLSFSFAYDILDILVKPAGEIKLSYLSPLDPFMVKFKIALFAGSLLAFPVVLYQVFVFVAPALKLKEKKLIYPIVFIAATLFASGVFFGYKYIMPVGTGWLLAQAEGRILAVLTVEKYASYAVFFLFAFGISFETPLFILFLVMLGVVSPGSLRRNWRYAYIIILVFAAMATPDWSPVTMSIFAAPMLILYEFSILLSWWYIRLRKKREKTLEGGVEIDATSKG
ncbi:MAG: twin-arginine translocase subunit TatC [Actinomycetota bacterium]|nr:twin-arginine translocase subunit TatC [Actinomycetota bacterium]